MTHQGDDANLVPVFTGHRMEAEMIRSLLEANDIPATVFGTGSYAFGAEDVSYQERVMVRSDNLDAARAAIAEAGVSDTDLSDMSQDDAFGFDDEADELEYASDDDEYDPAVVGNEPLAQGSDWGVRIVGLVGIAALVIAVIVILKA